MANEEEEEEGREESTSKMSQHQRVFRGILLTRARAMLPTRKHFNEDVS